MCVQSIAYESTPLGTCEPGSSSLQRKKRDNTNINNNNNNNSNNNNDDDNTNNSKAYTTASHNHRHSNNCAAILETTESPKSSSTPKREQPPRQKSKLLSQITTAEPPSKSSSSVVSVGSTSVSFDEQVLVRPVLLNLDDYSEQEKKACWLTRDDYRRIQTEALYALKKRQQQQQNHGGGEGPTSLLTPFVGSANNHCNHHRKNFKRSSSYHATTRGLERWLPLGRFQSFQRRRLALSAVFSEQHLCSLSFRCCSCYCCSQQKRQRMTRQAPTPNDDKEPSRQDYDDHYRHRHHHPCVDNHHTKHQIINDDNDLHLVLCENRAHRIREAYQRHTIAATDLARAMGKIDEKKAWRKKKTRRVWSALLV